jgi:flagellar biogenesis protein FliO
MLIGLTLLASVTPETTFAAGGSSWWQTLGGLLVVFGLLLLCLKILGKWNRRQGGGRDASVLTVWPLGPKREIQVLRLGDDVHFIYRHDNAMVLLKQQSLADFEAQRQGDETDEHPQGLKRFFPNGLPFPRLSAKSAAAAPDLTSP